MMIHPKDATRLGMTEGDSAELTTEAGKIVVPVEITEDLMPGVVSVPHGWGHSRKGTRQAVAEAHAGASINDIIRDDQIDLLSGTSVLNGQNVRVKVWKAEDSRKRA